MLRHVARLLHGLLAVGLLLGLAPPAHAAASYDVTQVGKVTIQGITDGNGQVEEVHGDGVVGEQPRLEPGEQFTYTSGATLPTSVGTMEGRYDMIGDDGTRFDAPIPPFTLAVPRTLH